MQTISTQISLHICGFVCICDCGVSWSYSFVFSMLSKNNLPSNYKKCLFLRTKSGFQLFLSIWENSISNFLYQLVEKIKNEQPHVNWCHHCNVKMTSHKNYVCRISSESGTSGIVSHIFQILKKRYVMVSKRKNPLFV